MNDPRPCSENAPDLAFARSVIRQEGEALLDLETLLQGPAGHDFTRILNCLLQASGRIVWTGIGKCSHIARKIAATMASTGTPSFFMHPAEASHGDLGMVSSGDVVAVLSWSGETPELETVIRHTRRFLVPLVAITGHAGSTLARMADHRFVLPARPEACPMGLAPTTSTTMMLALGDGLAMALLKHKSFGKEDFRNLHPGGKIGQMLLGVKDVMHTGDRLPLVPGSMPMHEALVVMTRKSLGCLGILDDEGHLAGIVTDGDLRRHMAPDLLEQTASAIMTPFSCVITPDAWVSEALGLMNQRKITSLFVVDGSGSRKVAGLIHLHQCVERGLMG